MAPALHAHITAPAFWSPFMPFSCMHVIELCQHTAATEEPGCLSLLDTFCYTARTACTCTSQESMTGNCVQARVTASIIMQTLFVQDSRCI